MGRYVFEKLPGRGGGTFIWDGTFIWHWIVSLEWMESGQRGRGGQKRPKMGGCPLYSNESANFLA